jgi:DNA modification methylase
MSSRGKDRKAELALHPTVKPVALVADAIRDVSNRNGIVLDCFGGSGSTLIAAHKSSRRARLIELDAIYVDRTIRRWQKYANDDALLFGTENTFEHIARNRSHQAKEITK